MDGYNTPRYISEWYMIYYYITMESWYYFSSELANQQLIVASGAMFLLKQGSRALVQHFYSESNNVNNCTAFVIFIIPLDQTHQI